MVEHFLAKEDVESSSLFTRSTPLTGSDFALDPTRFIHELSPGLAYASPTVLWRGWDAAEIALSFDDGPHPPSTGPLLDLLEARRVRATFFLLGKHLADPATHPVVRRMHHAGHQIGLHGWSHRPFPGMPWRVLARELLATRRLVCRITGGSAGEFCFVRPPFGAFTPMLAARLERWRFQVTMCNVLPMDWLPEVSDELVVARVVRDTAAGGSLVAMHDGVDLTDAAALRVVRCTGRILDALGERFRFVTARALLPPEADRYSRRHPERRSPQACFGSAQGKPSNNRAT